MVNIEQFKEVEIRIGEILSVEKVPETDRLLKLQVDFGELGKRQIVSGIAEFFPDSEVLVGKRVPFVTNLEPRTIKGLESQGMILAAHSADAFSLLESHDVPAGTLVG